jgi:hypothetical protein
MSVGISGKSTIKECLEDVTAVLRNRVCNFGKIGKVFGIIVFIQAGAVLKGIIFNENLWFVSCSI